MQPPILERVPNPTETQARELGRGRVTRAFNQVLPWVFTLAALAGGLSLVTDAFRMAMAKMPWPMVMAGGISAAALAILLAAVLGPLLAIMGSISVGLTGPGWRRWIRPLPLLAVSILVALAITSVRHRQDPAMRWALVVATALTVVVSSAGASASASRLSRVITLGLTGSTFLIDALSPRWYYQEVHDLLALCTLVCLLALAAPWRRRLAGARWWRPALLVGMVLSLLILVTVDRAVPGWRPRAAEHGLYGNALARAARAIVDIDRDGFSPVAWGGDCNDLSSRRHPLAVDAPGLGDMNCNGVDPPREPTDAQRGLASPAGQANLPSGAVDLVLLITVDAWRADALAPRLMPRMTEFAAQALVFERAYSIGTRTSVALPLVQSGYRGGVPLAWRMASHGIRTTAIIADHGMEGTEAVASTFERLDRPDRGRWPGMEATSRALRAIDEAGPSRHFMWLHYYDAHTPYPAAAAKVPIPAGLDSSYARYASGLAAVDRALGELVDGLDRRQRWDKTLVVITGDHGEAFGEHRMLFHAASCYEPLVRVPALLRAPGGTPQRARHLVSASDLYPTLLGAFALAQPGDERLGRSWLRLWAAPTAPLHEFVIVRSAYAASGGDVMSPMLAIVSGSFKLTKTLDSGLTELYDVVNDPSESRDLWPSHSRLGRQMERALETYRDVVGYPADEDLADMRTFGARLIGVDGQLY